MPLFTIIIFPASHKLKWNINFRPTDFFTSRNRGPKVKIQKLTITVTTEEKNKCRAASMSCVNKAITHYIDKINQKISDVYIVSDRCAAQFLSRFAFNFLIVFQKMCPRNGIIAKPTMAKAPWMASVAPSKTWSTVKYCPEMLSSILQRSLPNLLMKWAM